MKTFQDFNNVQVKALPMHLRRYIVEQRYKDYTAIDQAIWRYVMRQNYSYLKDYAHYPYIPGLQKAGLTIERIPSMQEINDALSLIGWGAVTVDGFIPPAAFMEYQARRVLVIAADMRTLEHIEYTPAPDFIHESAGHAPIISDPDYNQYLSYLGFLGTKAMSSKKDFELYEAIRYLSILKEIPDSDPDELMLAESRVLELQADTSNPSEMAMLSRLQWWTVEYGLIGSPAQPRIYGAGLLSSIGESVSCMRPEVQKILYTIDAVNYPYDITKPQPQLFVTPTFENLIDVLRQFEAGMAWRTGGASGIRKAIECRNICTAVLSSGLQISGLFSEMNTSPEEIPRWIRTTGPASLCFEGQYLSGLNRKQLPEGVVAVPGLLKGHATPLEEMPLADLASAGLITDNPIRLEWTSGVVLAGHLIDLHMENGKLLAISVKDGVITDGSEPIITGSVLYIGIGGSVTSVFNGAADQEEYQDDAHVSTRRTVKPKQSGHSQKYDHLLAAIRSIREMRQDLKDLPGIWTKLRNEYPDDWLGALEILELTEGTSGFESLSKDVRAWLTRQRELKPVFRKLIDDGVALVDRRMEFK